MVEYILGRGGGGGLQMERGNEEGIHNTAKCREQAEARPHHTAADDH